MVLQAMCGKCGGAMQREGVRETILGVPVVPYCLCTQCGFLCVPQGPSVCSPESCAGPGGDYEGQ